MTINNVFKASLMVFSLTVAGFASAATPSAENGVTTIHLDEYHGYFAVQETPVDLKRGQTRTARVTLSENGFRYRFPINPTPWYEVSVSK